MFESVSYIDLIDIYRCLFSSVFFGGLLLEMAEKKRDGYGKRIVLGSCALLLFGLLYLPFRYLQIHCFTLLFNALFTWLWWLAADAVIFLFLYSIYEVSVSRLLYYGILSLAVEEIHTVLFQYWLCKKCFPQMMEEHLLVYLMLLIGTIILCGILSRKILGKRLRKQGAQMAAGTTGMYALVWFSQATVVGITSAVFEWANGNVSFGSEEHLRYIAVPYYCIFIILVMCIIVIVMQMITYEIGVMEQEKRLLLMLQKEKAQQYAFSRENIDLINAKCHDLKHQIRALETMDVKDRKQRLEETEKAIDFYGAVVKTGQGVLDTVLTEKSMLCVKYGIRFSCNIQAQNMERVDVIDIYTILGNALDNAIECVCRYREEDKKVIHLSILEQGSMISIFVDNYFDGELKMQHGFPMTSKADLDYHGYGIRSIRMIAEKYDGTVRISHQNRTFSLQIMLRV